ncbi:hypothetical protein WFZ85_05045 [Flavobacterium sp. j3]|uniref:CDP-Glycerol:Poly(Glycerophosphate) glycerophosphotransferase n=1 Tax=Flavobacterium aureirubrum TaxID=3133147 RepID=A0ABU9N558_9FLAO
MKLGIVITDGVGYRNFMMSDFLIEASHSFDELVIFSCLPSTVYTNLPSNVKVIELTVFKEKITTWLFRKTKELAHLHLHKKDNFGILDNLNANYPKTKNVRAFLTYMAFYWTHLFHTEKWIQWYTSLQQFSFKNDAVTKEYYDILIKENIDLLFVTHQRPSFIAPLIYVSQKLKVKTATFIFSWDNLASKGRMAANFDYYLVWSNLMKEELLYFYKSVTADAVNVVGTPQFEPYFLDRYKISKDKFYEKFGLDNSKQTLCFSCGDISTSKNDELYIETIAKAIIKKLLPDVNFIVRTSPAENPIRFQQVAALYPFIIWNFPKWDLSREGHQEDWSQRVPITEDVTDLRALTEYSTININMLSTMSLDFMVFDKPVINTVFGNDENKLYNDQRFLNYIHIKKLINSQSTKVATTDVELIQAINDYLLNPNLDSNFRKKLVDLQISKPINGTGKRIANELLQWIVNQKK